MKKMFINVNLDAKMTLKESALEIEKKILLEDDNIFTSEKVIILCNDTVIEEVKFDNEGNFYIADKKFEVDYRLSALSDIALAVYGVILKYCIDNHLVNEIKVSIKNF